MANREVFGFVRLGDPIGFVMMDGKRLPVQPSEQFLRMLEGLFLNDGANGSNIEATQTEVATVTDSVDGALEDIETFNTETIPAINQSVTDAQDAANSANAAVTTLNTVTIPDLEARVAALEP